MHYFRLTPFLIAFVLVAGPSAANNDDSDASQEAKAFRSPELLLPKTRARDESPSPADLKARHDAALEIIKTAKQFLADFPVSKKVDDANSLMTLAISRPLSPPPKTVGSKESGA